MQGVLTFIGRIWRSGCLGKIGIGFVALIALGMCGATGQAIGVLPPPPPTRTPAPTATSGPTATPAPPTVAPTAAPTATPAPTRTPAPTPLGAGPVSLTACPEGFPVKGNIRDREPNKGEKIYHVPGGRSYDVTEPERCFASAAQAEQAGYRPAQ